MANIKVLTDTYLSGRNLKATVDDTRSMPNILGIPTDTTNTRLLMKGEDLTDSSTYNLSFTLTGSVTSSSAQQKFDNSLLFNNGSLHRLYSTDLHPFSQTSYQLDCWVYVNSTTGLSFNSRPTLVGHMEDVNGLNYWSFGPNVNRGLTFYYWNGTSSIIRSTANSLVPLNSWTHIAFSFSGGILRMFVNGVAYYTAANSGGQFDLAYNFRIGKFNNTSYNGYVDEMRILTNDANIWTSDFTPPDLPYYLA